MPKSHKLLSARGISAKMAANGIECPPQPETYSETRSRNVLTQDGFNHPAVAALCWLKHVSKVNHSGMVGWYRGLNRSKMRLLAWLFRVGIKLLRCTLMLTCRVMCHLTLQVIKQHKIFSVFTYIKKSGIVLHTS